MWTQVMIDRLIHMIILITSSFSCLHRMFECVNQVVAKYKQIKLNYIAHLLSGSLFHFEQIGWVREQTI